MTNTQNTTWTLGQEVTLIDDFNGYGYPTGRGVITKITAAQIVVRDMLGNTHKFWRKNNQIVGYRWPFNCAKVR